jgi:archaemetzincin
MAAIQPSGRVPKDTKAFKISAGTFPAPLVLPGDDLAEDGRYPAQSLRSWQRGEHLNPVTTKRRTIYIVGPPEIATEVEDMREWNVPNSEAQAPVLAHPSIDDVLQFFTAFYHGLDVRLGQDTWRFARWQDGRSARKKPNVIALETSVSAVRIRTRASLDGRYPYQLNLTDLLDACIEAVPEDAYALLLLVQQDMFEDDDDEFCCGRAYGGSRVAVVSTARYHPKLDRVQNVDREHSWPASHCATYMSSICSTRNVVQSRTRLDSDPSPVASAMQAAIQAHSTLPSLDDGDSPNEALEGLWLGRVCKTAAHEVGHCLGMDHCVYYACLMQGTANVGEDARQPPYLCPVDLAKYIAATRTDAQGCYEALLEYCLSKPAVHLFSAYAAWLRARLAEVREEELLRQT